MPDQEDLWPSDLLMTIPRTPKNILEEQAAALGPKTNNIVQSKVKTTTDPQGEFHHSFLLVCNALGGYYYTLFSVSHDMELYPVHADDAFLRDEADLKTYMKGILNSARTKNLVRALVAQAQGVPVAQSGEVNDEVPF